jgi:deoxyribodipyrimidine photolyase
VQEVLLGLIKSHIAKAVYLNRWHEPWRIQRDTKIKDTLRDAGIYKYL